MNPEYMKGYREGYGTAEQDPNATTDHCPWTVHNRTIWVEGWLNGFKDARAGVKRYPV